MKQSDPAKVNESLMCVQYLGGDINIKTSDNNTWLTHPKEVWELIEWLTNAVRYMQEQWEEQMNKEYTQAERDAYIDGHDAGYDAGWKAAIATLSANGNLRKPVQGDEVVIQEHTIGVVTATDDRGAVQTLQPNGAAIWVPAGAYRITGDKYELYDKLIGQLSRADMDFKNANVESN